MPEHIYTEGEKKLMQDYWEHRSKEPRENLIELVKRIDPKEKDGRESWGYIALDRQMTDEMVDFALNLKLRVPTYIDELAEKSGKTVQEAARIANELVHIGVLYYEPDDDGVDRVVLTIWIPGIMESVLLDTWRTDRYPELAVAFLNLALDGPKKGASMLPLGQGLMRTIPVQASIQNESKRADWEELSYWVEKHSPSLAAVECECRRARSRIGEGTADLEGEWCLMIGTFAESCIRVGKARRITKEECYDILRRAEENGYVHNIGNMGGTDETHYICNCEFSTCICLRSDWYLQTPNVSRSNFVAEVDIQNCVACGSCVEVCPQNVVKLGQKLGQKNPVEIHWDPIPDYYPVWGPNRWKPDFLTSRKNVQPETGTSPCKTDCPAHIAVQGYLKLAAQGKYMDALELIKKENPFPAVCGHICNRRCEQVCTRGDLDEPVSVDEVKKFIAQQELQAEKRFVPKKRFGKGHKVAVIGSGPAGLACAYYLAIYGHKVTVFEKENKLGGMLRFGIPSFRLEKDIIDAEIDVLRQLGVEFKTGVEIGKHTNIETLRNHGYKGFYVAIGAQGGRKLGVNGEDAEGVEFGVDFLRENAVRNGGKLHGKVVVIGGGNVAVDVARTAVRSGAESVQMYCVESRDLMPAVGDEVQEAESEGIVVNNDWGPREIITKDGRVCGIVFKKCVSVFDEEKRFNPKYDENDIVKVEADYVITAIGQSVQWGNVLEGSNVELNSNMTAKADGFTYQTTQPDIFVGGDVYTGPKFVIDAIAAGKQGAESIHRYVWGHDLVLGRDRRDYKSIDKDNLDIGEYDTAKRQTPAADNSKKLTNWDDRITLTEEQVKIEANRCLSCGAAHVDQNQCIGCGLCTTRCKFDAIHLIKKFDSTPAGYDNLGSEIKKMFQYRKKLQEEREQSNEA